MIAFPWIAATLVLVALAVVVLSLPGLLRTLAREHRLHAGRPAMRLVAIVTVLLLAALVAWGLVILPRILP